ncbi:hypothetical protein [Nocardia nepalensis]|uniref:hypothetical protein n=1 Tax=Nocardia nepalensis TaxID=3375448 RepID=UPI003B67DD60
MAPPGGSALVVDPNVYYEAAKKLTTLTDDINTAVTRDLLPGLTTSSKMGGNYPAVTGWNTAYHKHAGEVRTAVLAYAAALRHFGDVVNIAGYNWDAAEYNANTSTDKGAPPPHPVPSATNPLAANGFPEIPDPNGDNGAGVVITPNGQSPSSWTGAPNGRADALATAATAWDTFAYSHELVTSPTTLKAVHDTFSAVQAPEVPDILEALDALRGGAEQIGTVAKTLASETQSLHDNLIDARKELSAAAAGAFPSHPGAQVTTTTDNTSVRVSVDTTLSAVDVYNAENIFNTTAQNTTLFTVLSTIDYASHDFVAPNALSNLPKLKALKELPLIVESGNQDDNRTLVGELDRIATWETPAPTLTAADLRALDQYGPQMKSWATLAVKYGNEAGVDPRMALAMVLQEGAPLRTGLEGNLYSALQDPSTYHPNPNGPEAGILWDKARLDASGLGIDKHDAGNSIGLTNQKKGPFDEVKAKYPDQFKGQEWSDLVGNDDLAIKAAAYNLKMLNDDAASQATAAVKASQPLDQFLGSGYNAGGMVDRSLGVAARGDTFQPSEVEHGQSTLSITSRTRSCVAVGHTDENFCARQKSLVSAEPICPRGGDRRRSAGLWLSSIRGLA